MQHETFEREGHCLDRVTGDSLRIEVSRLGAEMVSLACRAPGDPWQGLLHRDGDLTLPGTGWKNHATVMGYYVHRLRNERTVYYGHELRGGTHSFVRHRIFDAPEVTETGLRYRLRADQIAPHEYPLQVGMELEYRLEGGTLRVVFRFDNREKDREAHVSFGLHPGFAVTSLAECQLILPAGRYARHLAPGNFLSGDVVEFEHAGGEMPFARSDLPDSFLLEMKETEGRTIVLQDPPSRREVALDFAEAPWFTVWSDGGPFLCVEPCWGLPDHQEQRPFEKKLGIQVLPPGGALEAGFSITPRLWSPGP